MAKLSNSLNKNPKWRPNYWLPQPVNSDKISLLEVVSTDIDIINVSSYPIVFSRDNKGGDTFVAPPPRSQVFVTGHQIEVDASIDIGTERSGPRKIYSGYVATEEGLATLSELEKNYPGAIIVGTLRAAEAYPGRILVPVPIPGHEKQPPSERIMRTDMFVRRMSQIPEEFFYQNN